MSKRPNFERTAAFGEGWAVQGKAQGPITSSFFVTEFGDRMEDAHFTPEEKKASMTAFRQMKQEGSGFEMMNLHRNRGTGPFTPGPFAR